MKQPWRPRELAAESFGTRDMGKRSVRRAAHWEAYWEPRPPARAIRDSKSSSRDGLRSHPWWISERRQILRRRCPGGRAPKPREGSPRSWNRRSRRRRSVRPLKASAFKSPPRSPRTVERGTFARLTRAGPSLGRKGAPKRGRAAHAAPGRGVEGDPRTQYMRLECWSMRTRPASDFSPATTRVMSGLRNSSVAPSGTAPSWTTWSGRDG